MGAGSWDTSSYTSSSVDRASKGIDDFSYSKSAHTVHDSLGGKRIKDKVFTKLESRDSAEHPESNPVLVCFDVTGSNYSRAVVAQKKLPALMDLLNKYLKDPQVAIAANDDFTTSGKNCFQMSEFESDNRVDEHIRNTWLISRGGSNDGESYDLLVYAAAKKVVLDSVEKRGKKGYMFMYADEPFFKQVSQDHVKEVFGDIIQGDIPIEEIIEEARRNFNIFVLWPEGGYRHAREQYVKLFGEEFVVTLQDPNLICEMIASIVGTYEDKATAISVVTDLVAVGVDKHSADVISKALAKVEKTESLVSAGGRKAKRL